MMAIAKDQLLSLRNLALKVLPSPIWILLHNLKINGKKKPDVDQEEVEDVMKVMLKLFL